MTTSTHFPTAPAKGPRLLLARLADTATWLTPHSLLLALSCASPVPTGSSAEMVPRRARLRRWGSRCGRRWWWACWGVRCCWGSPARL